MIRPGRPGILPVRCSLRIIELESEMQIYHFSFDIDHLSFLSLAALLLCALEERTVVDICWGTLSY